MPSRFLGKRLLLAIHRDQIQRFGGTPGLRDESLLDSALEQPMMGFAGTSRHPTIHQQSAAYLFHLVKNHPFVDGNKRVAFAAMDVFLRLNDVELTMSDGEAFDLVIRTAKGELTKDDIAAVLRTKTEPQG